MTITSNSALLPLVLSITFLCPAHFCKIGLRLCKDLLDFTEHHLVFIGPLISALCRNSFQEHYGLRPLSPQGSAGLRSQQGSSCTLRNQLTVIQPQWSELTGSAFKSEKGVTLFLLRVLFPPARIKQRLFADNTTPHLLGDICFATSLQSVGNGKENLRPSQLAHTNWHTPVQHTIMICGALFPFQSSFVPPQHLRR